MDWFRFYTGTLNSAKVQELPDKLFKAWVNFMCVARLFDGVLPGHMEIAFRLRISPERALKLTHELKKVGLIDEVCDQFQASELRKSGRKDVPGDHFFVMHDWDEWQKSSDDSAPRKRKQRVCLQMSRDMSQGGHALEQSRTEQKQRRAEKPALAIPTFVDDIEDRFARLYASHPTTGYHDEALFVYRNIVGIAVDPVKTADSIDASHLSWLDFWKAHPNERIPPLRYWFADKYYLKQPTAREPPKRRKSIDEIVEEMNAEDRANL